MLAGDLPEKPVEINHPTTVWTEAGVINFPVLYTHMYTLKQNATAVVSLLQCLTLAKCRLIYYLPVFLTAGCPNDKWAENGSAVGCVLLGPPILTLYSSIVRCFGIRNSHQMTKRLLRLMQPSQTCT